MKNIRALAYLAIAGVVAMPGLAKAQDETFQQFTSIDSLPNLRSWDISWVPPLDQGIPFYFLADRSDRAVDLVNTQTKFFGQYFAGNFVGFTGNNNTSGPDGLLTLVNTTNGTKEIWVGDGPQVNAGCPTRAPWNGKCSTTKVLDFATGNLTHTIITNGLARSDELCFDKVDRLILMANDADNIPFVSLISTDTYEVIGVLALPQATNGIEQCSWDPDQNLFLLNLPEVNGPGDDTAPGAVLVIVPTTLQVLGQYNVNIQHCAGPQGSALGPDDQLLLGCNAPSPSGIQSSVIINKRIGTEIAIAWGLGGADEVWFNPGDNHYAITGASCTPTGCLSHTNTQLAFVDAVSLTLDQVLAIPKTTGVSPHSVAIDPASNQVYFPNFANIGIFAPTGRDSDD
jgi:DNA-binding beta-propeller fold protein YncE